MADKNQKTVERKSCRPESISIEDQSNNQGKWHMVQTAPGNYMLVDTRGNGVVTLFEPLHEDEIQALGDAFTKTVLSGIEQGRKAEYDRIAKIVQLLR